MTITNQDRQFKTLNIGTADLKVSVKIVEQKKLMAIASIDFGDFIIKGFRIYHSDYKKEGSDEAELWIVPPSYRDGGGKYRPIFFAPDKELWRAIEVKISEAYQQASDEHYKKRFDMPDFDN